MLVFPQWRPEVAVEGCRLQRWLPAERFAPYIARTVALPPTPPQVEDEDSGDSCTEHTGPLTAERTGPLAAERTGPLATEGEWSACGWAGCGARLPGVARLSAHVARTHAVAHRDGMFYCRWEGCARPLKGFNARYKMLVHVRTHTNERPHRCAQCDKCFSRAENLKIHLRSHSGEKPYVCPYEGCGKAYSNSSDRFKHTRTHTVDKPYCCKVYGCNKRYTDPSSLRKHVKTYRHFTPKDTHRPDDRSSDETSSPSHNSSRYVDITPISPQQQPAHSPPRLSPTIPPYNPILPLSPPASMLPLEYTPLMDRVTYIKTLEPMYPLPHEMSYMEYTQMYEHAYRNYYSSGLTYPILRPSVGEKRFAYEHKRLDDISMEVMESQAVPVSYRPIEHEMPLNLKCERRLECKPIEELMRRTDLPLDLSINIDSVN